MDKTISKWKTIDIEKVGNFKVFDLYYKTRINPNTNIAHKFTSLDAPTWVNIVATTNDNKILLVEQYRHGIDEISLELPAGIVEPNEDPLDAAKRECIEETGYVGQNDIILLGKVRPNPAFLNNYCYHYLWERCDLNYDQKLDENEDIRVVLYPIEEIINLIQTEKLQHTLTLSALMLYFLNKNLHIWQK
ncbi:MAG: NUDIX hydrolase [Bacteroidetes bacterium]|nr:NUDIX hydrolase [Bacteroidota bacterium]